MKFLKALLCVSILVPAMAFAAQPPAEIRYDYLDLGLTFGEVDSGGGDVDFSGLGIAGSWGFHDNFALFAGLGAGEIDAFGDIDTTELTLGINPHFAIAENLDLVIPVAIEWVDFDAGPFSDDDTGFSIGVGVRWLINPAWEFGAGFQHVEIFDGDEQTVGANIRWHLSRLFSLGLGGNFGDDTTAVLFDARFSFGG
jgi:hypothetical protein